MQIRFADSRPQGDYALVVAAAVVRWLPGPAADS